MLSGRTKPSVREGRYLLSGSCPSIGSHAMPRLFTGLEIPAEIGHTLSGLRGGLPGARWIDPENYHVTLRFIGDIDGVSANEIASMLFRINRKPFEVQVPGLSSFGGK